MKTNNCLSFGMAVRKRRKELHYTQAYLSEVTGISASFISDLENGKETAELGKSIRIANMLGMDVMTEVRGKS